MTNQEILTRAIEKAIAGGWDGLKGYPLWNIHDSGNSFTPALLCVPSPDKKTKAHIGAYEVIFNHGFAKALWGEPKRVVATKTTLIHPPKSIFGGWQYHLQQMVIADDAIKYLGENL